MVNETILAVIIAFAISAALCLISALAGRLFAYAFKKEEDE